MSITLKNIVRIILLLFVAGSVAYLVINEYVPSRQDAEMKRTEQVEAQRHEVILYYFHGTRRCNTCRTIEAYIAEALKTYFPDDLSDKKLAWNPVNIDDPWNNHFIDEYSIDSSAAVLVDMRGKEAVKWKKLDLVWKLVHDKTAFLDYIHREVADYLPGGIDNE